MKKVVIIFLAFIIFILSVFFIVFGIEYGWFENYGDYKTEYISTESDYSAEIKIPSSWIIEKKDGWINIVEKDEIIARQLYQGGWENYSVGGVNYNNWEQLEFNPNIPTYNYDFSLFTLIKGANNACIYEVNNYSEKKYLLLINIVDYKNGNDENIIFVFEKTIDLKVIDKIKKSVITSGYIED